MTMTVTDLVSRYATYSLQRDRMVAAGRPVPEDLQQALDFMESLSRDFSPEQQEYLRQEVELRRDALLNLEMQQTIAQVGQKQQAASVLAAALRDHHTQKATTTLSRDGKGLNEQQFTDLSVHGKYVMPGKERTMDRLRAQLRERGLDEDPKQLLARWGELVDNPNDFERYAERLYPGDELSKATLKREISSVVIGSGLALRREMRADPSEFKPYVIEATPQERRRADVMNSAARLGAVDAIAGDAIRADSLADEGVRGAVARAMAAHDAVEGDPLDQIDGDEYRALEHVAEHGAL